MDAEFLARINLHPGIECVVVLNLIEWIFACTIDCKILPPVLNIGPR